MFKRIEKKAKKRKRDEELGLDDEAKQVLGLQDTDSDESESDSDLESSLGSGSGDGEDGSDSDSGSDAEMLTEWLGEGLDSGDEIASDEEGLATDDGFDDEPPITLGRAMIDPIFQTSANSDIQGCMVCPQKALKNSKMVEVHLKSSAHSRRYTKFLELAKRPKHRNRDPRYLVAFMNKLQPKAAPKDDQAISRRGLKRKRKLDKIRRKREAQKEIIAKKRRKRERKAAEPGDDDAAKPDSGTVPDQSKKRQKTEDDEKDKQDVPKVTQNEKVPELRLTGEDTENGMVDHAVKKTKVRKSQGDKPKSNLKADRGNASKDKLKAKGSSKPKSENTKPGKSLFKKQKRNSGGKKELTIFD